MRKISIILALIVQTNPLFAGAEYTVTTDEMTDVSSFIVFVNSENYGKFKYKGKARLIYECSRGKPVVILRVPDYLSNKPKKIQIRFDKDDPYESKDVTGTADKYGIIIYRDAPLLMTKMINQNQAVARAFNWEWTSEAAYKFNLLGVSKLINKANKAGKCLTLNQRISKKIESEKRKKEAFLTVSAILGRLDGGTINVKASEWHSLTREAQDAIEEKVRVFILGDNDPQAISLFE